MAFERLFKERGLPQAIRSDNGVPFASPNGLFNLSKLSAWWLRVGITIERIRPGHSQQNGRHERMHLTLKQEATRPDGQNILQQRAKFDDFIEDRHRRAALSVSRPIRRRHPLRPPVPLQQENQSQLFFSWSGSWRQRSRRRHLAGQLYAVRSRLRRSGGENFAACGQSVWPKSVTYVSGSDSAATNVAQRAVFRTSVSEQSSSLPTFRPSALAVKGGACRYEFGDEKGGPNCGIRNGA